VCKKCKCPLTEEASHVVCEGTRRYRICATCIQEEVGFESLPMEDSLEGLDQEPALLLGVDGEEEGETQRSWLTSMEQEQDEDEEPFVAPAGLTIPPDVELVSDRRIHDAVVLSIDQSA
jgi:hypothetical protein